MSRRWSIIIAVIGAVLIILIFALAYHDCSEKAKCRERGGVVEEYDCGTVVICSTINKITTCTPTRVCKWRCVMPKEK